MKKKIKKDWIHLGGGCQLKSTKKYPCDDIYVNEKSKKEFTVFSTIEAHSKMPDKVSGMKELLKRKGISGIDK